MHKRSIITAPAKVNLFLGVGGIRPDGYHEVTTVLHALELADEVTVEESDELSVDCHPDVCASPLENTAFRAATLLAENLGRPIPAAIRVLKRIPHGAGLGGGSSDAAAVLLGVARLMGLEAYSEPFMRAARAVGADVPFFMHGGAALMGDRGDRVEKRLPALSAPVVLVRPPLPVSTAEAYAAFDCEPVPAGDVQAVIDALQRGDVRAVAAAMSNNLEAASISVVPEVSDALAWIRERTGALGAMVAGSGSAVFALMDAPGNAERAAIEAASRGWWGAATRLSSNGAYIQGEGNHA